ncbi:UNVERIFIED_ORG: osmotically-inducible protein OsmY [Rhizobium aethiopicum]|uniref:BON domain-containing protein n=1 Tax=unclassified Rhizobium TaxID=2613769 RepID=UPI0007EA894F|nr:MULTISPECIES: BON domain-containing protein [unclassified Rhizobium]ANM13566.1 BON domain-containing protein [Rhizobium sp. N324]ANM19952.1 BON domain-containing protein [Rhizobium sp. N541]ANM26337.1 BON domain-containing protein [Rhizobium sp. N941]OYD00599.1 BON domain-containing protein [Rhizobium sp. N4311]
MRALLDVRRQCTASGDEALGTAVRGLETEFEIRFPIVNATVSNGAVTLRGEVETELECSAARVAAESIRGVGGVVNNITLATAW